MLTLHNDAISSTRNKSNRKPVITVNLLCWLGSVMSNKHEMWNAWNFHTLHVTSSVEFFFGIFRILRVFHPLIKSDAEVMMHNKLKIKFRKGLFLWLPRIEVVFWTFSLILKPSRSTSKFNYASLDAQDFECPSDRGFFPDSVQCDKYYECRGGVATAKLCADGLVFDENIKRINKCDQPFNVDCGDRTELRMDF